MRLGIDIGGTKTAAVVLDDTSRPVALQQVPSGRGADVVDVAVRAARAAVEAAGGPDVVTSIGACAPGVVDIEHGLVRHAVNLGVDELALGAELAARLGHPVVVDNDVKAAAVGAFLLTGAAAEGTFGYLNLGTGLAASVIRDGRLDRGPDGLLGEIGHVPVGGTRPCTCGQVGCLETLASGAALERRLGPWRPSGPTIFERAATGDREAAEAAEELVHGIRIALHLLVVAAGASRVVVGGGLVGLGEPLVDRLRDAFAEADRRSRLHAALGLWARTSFVRSPVPLAALGAAALPGFAGDDPVAVAASHAERPHSHL